MEKVVFFRVEGFDEQTKIQQSVFQPFLDPVCVVGEQFDGETGIFLMEFPESVGDPMHGPGFSGTDPDAAGKVHVVFPDLFFGLVHQGQDFFCPLAQVHPFFRQGSAPVGPDKELFAQFLFQVRHLPGQGGLGDEQHIGGLGHVLFPGHRQKIFQGADFHSLLLQ